VVTDILKFAGVKMSTMNFYVKKKNIAVH